MEDEEPSVVLLVPVWKGPEDPPMKLVPNLPLRWLMNRGGMG